MFKKKLKKAKVRIQMHDQGSILSDNLHREVQQTEVANIIQCW